MNKFEIGDIVCYHDSEGDWEVIDVSENYVLIHNYPWKLWVAQENVKFVKQNKVSKIEKDEEVYLLFIDNNYNDITSYSSLDEVYKAAACVSADLQVEIFQKIKTRKINVEWN